MGPWEALLSSPTPPAVPRGNFSVPRPRLSDLLSGKDNNLNLVRFLAAFAVLVSHSFVLATGDLSLEPLRGSLGMSLGEIAVDLFFAASGFLVARSLVQRGSGIDFLWARLLRIYPALLAMLLGCVLVVAPVFGILAFPEFLLHRGTMHFLFQNVVLVRGVELSLPGVFLDAPWKGIVNGSLWTLTYELRLYLSLLALWWVLKPCGSLRPLLFRWACSLVALGAFVWHAATLAGADTDVNGLVDPTPRLVLMFYSGVVWWIASSRVRLDGRWLLGASAVLFAAWTLESWLVFHLLFALWVPYALWWVSFVPVGWIRAFNRFGDPSYGIYIYAFPIQQAWILLFPGTGPWAMILGAGVPTIALGYLSWHLLEERCLRYKDLPRRILSRFRQA